MGSIGFQMLMFLGADDIGAPLWGPVERVWSDRLAMRNLTIQNLGLRDFKSRLRDLQVLEGDEAVEKTAFSVLESGHAPGGPMDQVSSGH